MDNEIAIKVDNLSKIYKLYDKPIDRLKESLNPFWKKYSKNFYALNNISFEIKKGEIIGIIGKNGAGKSTLLKILTNVLTPTSGIVETSGKISALLELGAGFNPEMTGMENIYLNGTIMGYTHEEMKNKVDAIVKFADIGDFIYQPVRMYSSGMFVRLAFSVAINVDPEILIIDEALSVGDDLFQNKCFGKINKFRNEGKTILFVSHSGSSIIELCDRAIWIDQGEKLLEGKSEKVVNLYQKMLFAPEEKVKEIRQQLKEKKDIVFENPKEKQSNVIQTNEFNLETQEEVVFDQEYFDDSLLIKNEVVSYENQKAKIYDYKMVGVKGVPINILNFGRRYTFSYKVKFLENCTNVRFGMLIKTKTGIEVTGCGTAKAGNGIPFVKAGTIIKVQFSFVCKFIQDVYFLKCGVVGIEDYQEVFYARELNGFAFRVLERKDGVELNALVDMDISANFDVLDKDVK